MRSTHNQSLSLDGNWTLYYEENRKLPPFTEYPTENALKTASFPCVKAKVPGNFEIDLQNAGIIGDVFFGKNPSDAQKEKICISGTSVPLKSKTPLPLNSSLKALIPLPIFI